MGGSGLFFILVPVHHMPCSSHNLFTPYPVHHKSCSPHGLFTTWFVHQTSCPPHGSSSLAVHHKSHVIFFSEHINSHLEQNKMV